ncbi:MAG: SdrD B-like domain-containing protein [Corynebacterium sp.]|nr:SdrD B-like domain-containing protein [Corynebacterium sp.]
MSSLATKMTAVICAAAIGISGMTATASAQATEGELPTHTVGISAASDFTADAPSPFLDFDAATGIMRVDATWAAANNVDARTVIAVGRTEDYRQGLIRWVTDTPVTEGTTTILRTREARLNEVFAGLPEATREALDGHTITGEAQGVEGVVTDPDAAASLESTLIAGDGAKVETTTEQLGSVGITGTTTTVTPDTNPAGVEIYKPFGKDFSFDFSKSITAASCQDGTFVYSGAETALPTTCNLAGDGSLNADIHLSMGAGGAFTFDTERLTIQEISLLGQVHIDGDTELATTGEIYGTMEWQLADLNFPFTVPLGPVPLTINVGVTPTIGLEIDSDGNAHAAIRDFRIAYTDVGLSYTSDNGFELREGTPDVNIPEPTLDGASFLHAGLNVQPKSTVDLGGILGVGVNVGAQTSADFMTSQTNPVCIVNVGMLGSIGLMPVSLTKIAFIGWLLGGLEAKLNDFIATKAQYSFDVPNMYSSLNLCANNPITIGDRVWFDQNKNGMLDSTEPGIANAHVFLVRGMDKGVVTNRGTNPEAFAAALVAETTTDAEGYYRFASTATGPLMPGEYTVVVEPPTASTANPEAPFGYVPTKAYTRDTTSGLDPHSLSELQRDSGGEYAWNTDSYSSFFDGTRWQDSNPLTEAIRYDSTTPIAVRRDAIKAAVLEWAVEIAQTNGYNDTVDFGFVAADENSVNRFRTTGKIYVADPAADTDTTAGMAVGNLDALVQGRAVPKATVVFTPLNGTPGVPTEVTTDIGGRYTAELPAGTYRVELTALPEGFTFAPHTPYATTVQIGADTSARLLIPDAHWVNSGVVADQPTLIAHTYADVNENGVLDAGDMDVTDSAMTVSSRSDLMISASATGMFVQPIKKGAFNTDTTDNVATFYAPAGRTFADTTLGTVSDDKTELTVTFDTVGNAIAIDGTVIDSPLELALTPLDSEKPAPALATEEAAAAATEETAPAEPAAPATEEAAEPATEEIAAPAPATEEAAAPAPATETNPLPLVPEVATEPISFEVPAAETVAADQIAAEQAEAEADQAETEVDANTVEDSAVDTEEETLSPGAIAGIVMGLLALIAGIGVLFPQLNKVLGM